MAKEIIQPDIPYKCYKCGDSSKSERFSYQAKGGKLFTAMNDRIPICKNCLKELYIDFLNNVYNGNEYEAIRRICIMYNIYYSRDIVSYAKVKNTKENKSCLVFDYITCLNLAQFKDKRECSYSDTVHEEYTLKELECVNADISFENEYEEDFYSEIKVTNAIRKKFGYGFKDEEYAFLQGEYDDWTSRHECKTKVQEELFKRIAFKQLEILKATREGKETKDLDKSFQDLLNVANLQPKQNSKETTSDAVTMGLLIQKFETTNPISEIDPELADVDKIGLYLDVFFRGHLAKLVNIKNAFSNLYTKFISKYTVHKPQYSKDEDTEIVFDAIFGNASFDDDDIYSGDGEDV